VIAYDYADRTTDSETWTSAQLSALGTSSQMLQVDLTQPECTAFQLSITDVAPTGGGAVVGTGQGPIYIGLQAIVSTDDGLAKLPEVNRK
jgi:hypothetical protein